MQFMVIEHFKNRDARPVYRRLGRRWIARCLEVRNCDDGKLREQSMARWNDLVDFEIGAGA